MRWLLVDQSVAEIKQINGAPWSIFPSGIIAIDATAKTSTGEQELMKPLGDNGPYRLLCDKLPAHTGVTIIEAIANTTSLEKAFREGNTNKFRGIGPNGLLEMKTIPRWVRLHSTYKAGPRPYSVDKQIEPTLY